MRRSCSAFLLACVVLLNAGSQTFASNTGNLSRFQFKHAAMGTLFYITLYAADEPTASAAAKSAFARIDDLEDIMSDYQADSELMRLCDQPFGKPVPVSKDLFDVMARAQKISAESHGAFDITVGPYVRLWRFARKRKILAGAEEMSAARAAVGYMKLKMDPGAQTVTLLVPHMRLDLGGIAKGYAADQALLLLKQKGIDRALVAASGDLAIGNPPPGEIGWKIGVSEIDIANTNALNGTLLLANCGISTSGDTEQSILIDGVRYSHILDPATGLGLTNRIQASILAPDATATDALATTVCILGLKKGLALVESTPGCAALLMTKQGDHMKVVESRRFKKLPKSRY